MLLTLLLLLFFLCQWFPFHVQFETQTVDIFTLRSSTTTVATHIVALKWKKDEENLTLCRSGLNILFLTRRKQVKYKTKLIFSRDVMKRQKITTYAIQLPVVTLVGLRMLYVKCYTSSIAFYIPHPLLLQLSNTCNSVFCDGSLWNLYK
jgi:hypothetical protein